MKRNLLFVLFATLNAGSSFIMKRSLSLFVLAILIFAGCKKDQTEPDPLTVGTWKAVGALASRQPDGWVPVADGPTLIFRNSGIYEGFHPSNPNGKTTGFWKRSETKPDDVPEGTLVLETRSSTDSKVHLMLIDFLSSDEIKLTYYIDPAMRPFVNSLPPYKYRRQ